MTFKLKTGATIELPTLSDVDKAIEGFEEELRKLRRLRKVVDEMNTTDAVAGKIIPPQGGSGTAPPQAEAK